ncbi:MAG: hypothetical protein VB143_04220 [Burkholderia sp.]
MPAPAARSSAVERGRARSSAVEPGSIPARRCVSSDNNIQDCTMSHAIAVALFLHLLAVAVWVGGMVFAHFCLRPALSDLSPQCGEVLDLTPPEFKPENRSNARRTRRHAISAVAATCEGFCKK